MRKIPCINIEDFDYRLPEGRIAQFPVKERDSSKLLVYKGGVLSNDIFRNVHDYIPDGSVMVFNNARVIRARLHFMKKTGAVIEILCLEPLNPTDYGSNLSSEGPVEWKCLIGNLKKWKTGILRTGFAINGLHQTLSVEKMNPEGDAWRVRFSWDPLRISFSEVLEAAGRIPLPPYVKREDSSEDSIRYQTLYSKNEGSVAAPTAGLHFTDNVLKNIHGKKIKSVELTLHVGAGTFKPVKEQDISRHEMHRERFLISRESLTELINDRGNLIAVGTTSVRTLESIYWLGVKAIRSGSIGDEPEIEQWEWTESNKVIPPEESLQALLGIMERKKMVYLSASTSLMIVPGYSFRMIKGMITNFHQPRSTLLLLVSAWVGDNWKMIYKYALDNGFRFLSYGDVSILLP